MTREQPDAAGEPKARAGRAGRKVVAAWAAWAVALGVAAGAAVAYRPIFLGNFGVVDPGLVYRSGQPGGGWGPLIRDLKLATVVNLRGGSGDDDWYAREVEATRAAGVDFYDMHLGATRRPSRVELLELVDVFGRARYPLLIHCKAGSDRTGMAAAIYLMVRRGVGPDEAAGAFTVRHGHVPVGGTEKLHEPFREYADWLAARRLPHTPGRFRGWIEAEYRDDRPGVAFRPLRPGPRTQGRVAGGTSSKEGLR